MEDLEITRNMEVLEVQCKAVKWITHYCSSHKILLVGEGDFSFALCLAKAFGSASNITATSLDTQEELGKKYDRAKANIEELKALGCTVIHGVDVHTMNLNPVLSVKCFERIVFNFPHAGFDYILREQDSFTIQQHQKVVRGFLKSAKQMVKEEEGEIHITHKTSHPFSLWKIETLAEEEGLFLVEEVPFYKWKYPDYSNKRGSGLRCDNSFPVGAASTFKFKISDLLYRNHN